jgi:hypothetical protein
MNEARRKEIQRAQILIAEAKSILELATAQEQDDFDNMPEDLQGDEEGQSAQDVIDAVADDHERVVLAAAAVIDPKAGFEGVYLAWASLSSFIFFSFLSCISSFYPLLVPLV